MTYQTFADKASSQKILLAHVHATKRIVSFVADSGKYSHTPDFFVFAVKNGSTALTSVASLGALTDNTKYFYDKTNNKLWLFSFTSSTDEIIVEYRLFFSTLPINLSYDLTDGGFVVEYEPRLVKTPQFKSSMSQGKKGINLVGKGELSLNNNDGFYDQFYNTMYFENATVKVYSFNRDLLPSEAKLLFKGVITGKSFSSKEIGFNVANEVYKLDNLVPSTKYGVAVRSADKNRYKRVIYGKVSNLLCQSIDQLNTGYTLTGTLAGVVNENFVTGTGTSFLSELTIGDVITTSVGDLTVERVKTDTLIMTSQIPASFTGETCNNLTKTPYYNKNREFQIAGHALKKFETTISALRTSRRFEVVDPTGLNNGDEIFVNGEKAYILNVSGNTVRLTTFTVGTLAIGQSVVKREVESVTYGTGSVIDNNDVTVTNDVSGATFSITASAERNITPAKRIRKYFNFINGSNIIYLGYPSIYNITTLANVSDSLAGKYFILRDKDSRTTAFWYQSNTAPVSEPSTGANLNVRILLSNPNTSANDVANLTHLSINQNIDYYKATVSTNVVNVSSVRGEVLSAPTANTSGFTITLVNAGTDAGVSTPLSSLIKPRDFVNLDGSLTAYDVLEVTESSVILRQNYAAASSTNYLQYKNIDYIKDDTPVLVTCSGKTKDGTTSGGYITTTSEVVQDLLESVGLTTSLNLASFITASSKAPQLVSLALPETFTTEGMPTVRAVVNNLNKSVLGSLYVDEDFNLGYDILDNDVDLASLRTIRDDDLIDWQISADNFDIVKQSIVSYRQQDYLPAAKTKVWEQVEYTSPFVEKYINNDSTLVLNAYVYDDSSASEISHRLCFANSLGNNTINLTGPLALTKYRLGERVKLDVSRMFESFGGLDSLKLGVITSIKNSGSKVDIELEDVGSLFARTGRIADDLTNDYVNSNNEERVLAGFITNDDGSINSEDDTFSINLIG